MALFGGLFYLADTTGRTALISIVSGAGTAITAFYINRARQDINTVREEVAAVKDHVNGNTRALIQKIPEPERPLVTPQID
jgi:hypothetical protein